MNCKAITASGEPCKRGAVEGSDYCNLPKHAMLNDIDQTSGEIIKTKATTPWKPANRLDIPQKYKKSGWIYRFCSSEESRPGNITKKLQEGWIVDKEVVPAMERDGVLPIMPTLNDGKRLDSTFKMRELIVMRIPQELADSRKKYYADRTNSVEKGIQNDLRKNLGDQFNSKAEIYENN